MDAAITAWRQCSRCRPVGFGPAFIPWSEIDAWLRAKGADPETYALLERVLLKLDSDHLAALAARRTLDANKD